MASATLGAFSEVVRLGDRAATYGVGAKKMTEGFVYVMPHTSWVNLGFYQGALLPDPDRIREGTGTALRHVKIRTGDDVNREACCRGRIRCGPLQPHRCAPGSRVGSNEMQGAESELRGQSLKTVIPTHT